MKFDTRVYFFFRKCIEKNPRFVKNLASITGILHEDQYTFVISRSNLMKIHPVETDLFHPGTDRHDKANTDSSKLCERADKRKYLLNRWINARRDSTKGDNAYLAFTVFCLISPVTFFEETSNFNERVSQFLQNVCSLIRRCISG